MGNQYSVQANLMDKATVWDAMAEAYETTEGDLTERLRDGLPGFSFLRVVCPLWIGGFGGQGDEDAELLFASLLLELGEVLGNRLRRGVKGRHFKNTDWAVPKDGVPCVEDPVELLGRLVPCRALAETLDISTTRLYFASHIFPAVDPFFHFGSPAAD